MSIHSEKELAEFLAPLPPWVRKVLQWDYSSLDPQEWLEHNRQQDKIIELRLEYERILRQMHSKWNAYCKAQRLFLDETKRIEEKLIVRVGAPGRPSKDAVADEAAHLKEAGMSYARVAARLNHVRGLKPTDFEYATSESIRKLLKRHRASQGSTPDAN